MKTPKSAAHPTRLGGMMRIYRVVTRQVTLSVLASEIGVTAKLLSRFEQGGDVMQQDWLKVQRWLMESDDETVQPEAVHERGLLN